MKLKKNQTNNFHKFHLVVKQVILHYMNYMKNLNFFYKKKKQRLTCIA